MVLYHGRLNYIRISEFILYFFYKNFFFTIPQFYFAFFNMFSGSTIFEDWYISFYNLFFTALPVAIRSVLDFDLNHKTTKIPDAEDYYPYVYYVGQRGTIFTFYNFLSWIKSAILHSSVCFIVSYLFFVGQPLGESGENSDHWAFSVTYFSCIILIVNIRLMVYSRSLNIIHFLGIFLTSVLFFFVYGWVSNYVWYSKTYVSYEEIYASPNFYLAVFFTVGLVAIFDIGWVSVNLNIWPTCHDFLRLLAANRIVTESEKEKLKKLHEKAVSKKSLWSRIFPPKSDFEKITKKYGEA